MFFLKNFGQHRPAAIIESIVVDISEYRFRVKLTKIHLLILKLNEVKYTHIIPGTSLRAKDLLSCVLVFYGEAHSF